MKVYDYYDYDDEGNLILRVRQKRGNQNDKKRYNHYVNYFIFL